MQYVKCGNHGSNWQEGAIMLIGVKNNCNHYLFFLFFTPKVLHIIKFNILFYKCPKYEIISSTFGPFKIV
jgi:hypothetical protein